MTAIWDSDSINGHVHQLFLIVPIILRRSMNHESLVRVPIIHYHITKSISPLVSASEWNSAVCVKLGSERFWLLNFLFGKADSSASIVASLVNWRASVRTCTTACRVSSDFDFANTLH